MERYIFFVGAILLGGLFGYLLRVVYARISLANAEKMAKRIISEAEAKAEAKKKEGLLEIKEVMERERREFERETYHRRKDLENLERRLSQKEENLDRKLEILEKKERDTEHRERSLLHKEKIFQEEQGKLNQEKEESKKVLERLAAMSAEEAKKILLQSMEEEARREAALLAKNIEQEAKEQSEKKAKEILALAVQRCAADHTAEITITSVPLPNEEVKGRIIGREGRNIRAFEQLTGVDLIVDDTPESITLSAFDGVRREIARLALERLIADGRIHPGRIEEVVERVKREMEVRLKEIGEEIALEIGVSGLPVELLKLLGKLKYRTSYGQNQLQHTLEVAWVASTLAGELGADVNFCKKAALLHDLGKAIDHDVEGTHHQISADVAQKYGESEKMVNAILAHHEAVEPKSLEAVILAAADAVSAARPGARKESVEHYLKRIEKLEKIASSIRGVLNAYAIQAGREIRIIVEPEEIDDAGIAILAKDVAKKIEKELEYPGQVKVTVIRELRAIETAK